MAKGCGGNFMVVHVRPLTTSGSMITRSVWPAFCSPAFAEFASLRIVASRVEASFTITDMVQDSPVAERPLMENADSVPIALARSLEKLMPIWASALTRWR